MRKSPLLAAALIATFIGCSKDEAAPAPSASAAPSVSAPAPTASTPPPPPPAPPEPQHDCPTGSTGPGSFTKPCEAKGGARMMDVKWKKTDDKGPSFAITNKSKLVVLYGKIEIGRAHV